MLKVDEHATLRGWKVRMSVSERYHFFKKVKMSKITTIDNT